MMTGTPHNTTTHSKIWLHEASHQREQQLNNTTTTFIPTPLWQYAPRKYIQAVAASVLNKMLSSRVE